ncbi:GTPase Era [Dissostichus eleginoides]|uniref:GTPase Era n=1 Tax=Dissostichus eleginoides TaxID=100907 RepID=A0AAD9CDH1_DISEL|nr:GTPase Era [Dissostichus eleginoides]
MSHRSSRQHSDAPPPAESVFAPDCILHLQPFPFFIDYPNFESSWRSDVKQISGRVANPVASPQPVIGIHFEVIIGRATDSNPPVLFKFPR